MIDDYQPGKHLDVETLERINELKAQLSDYQRQLDEALKALKAASGALMSYQYGNSSPELAEEVREFCDNTALALCNSSISEKVKNG